MRRTLCFLLIAILCALLCPPKLAAQDDPATRFVELVNQARLDEGLPPYAWSDRLAASAQRHADDLAAHGLASHIGSDGSTAAQRIAAADYLAWDRGTVVGENFWVGTGDWEDAFEWFMRDPPHRDNILSARFREMGVGFARDDAGQNYYVLDFGARPNVLPVFINDGAETTVSLEVTITLTNENAHPQGKGTTSMGRAIEVRLGNAPDLEAQPWQPWSPQVEWTLPLQLGEVTVYVAFRDGAGRVAYASDTITVLPIEGTPLPTPTVAASPTPTPPAAGPATPLPPSPTPPISPPTPQPTPTATPVAVAAVTATPFATWTPLPRAALPVKHNPQQTWLWAACGLQAVALLLGAWAALRRRS